MKVALVLLGRFPTDKAYGVTSTATIECLNSMGHEVTVYSFDSVPHSSNVDNYKRKAFKDNNYTNFLRKQFSKNNKFVNQIYWKLYIRKYLHWVQLDCRKEHYQLIWMRNFETFQKLSLLQSSFLLELHSILNNQQISFIKKYNGNLLLAPISKKIKSQCEKIAIPHAFAPMGINSSFLASNLEIDDYLPKLRKSKILEFVYVGKLFPGGISKGVETLISIAKFAQKNLFDLKIKVIGGNETEIIRFREIIARENVHTYFELKGQQSHEIALRELKDSDVVILTKSTDPNYAGFPLKAMEALASGRVTVVEENDAYKDAFDEDAFVIWFNRDLIENIFLQIKAALNDNQLDSKLKANVEIAKKYTWINRTQFLLAKIFKNQPS